MCFDSLWLLSDENSCDLFDLNLDPAKVQRKQKTRNTKDFALTLVSG